MMERFNQINDGEKTVVGEGYYKRENLNIYIETTDSNIVQYFVKLMRDKKHLKSIEFSNEESWNFITGNFIIEKINKGSTTSIYLKKSEKHI